MRQVVHRPVPPVERPTKLPGQPHGQEAAGLGPEDLSPGEERLARAVPPARNGGAGLSQPHRAGPTGFVRDGPAAKRGVRPSTLPGGVGSRGGPPGSGAAESLPLVPGHRRVPRSPAPLRAPAPEPEVLEPDRPPRGAGEAWFPATASRPL